jgi:hypothetical protein
MTDFPNIQSGAEGVLYETAKLLNQLGTKYIIVGGWTTYLLNSEPIKHPGTKDVDVLFDQGYVKGSLKPIILEFLSQGFILSAKHDFQLFKEISVGGETFIYNVDLLHPLETAKPKDIYVEQIDLDIPADKYQSKTFKLKSIALPSSQSLFNNNIVTDYTLQIKIGDLTLEQTVPLMGELGTLITKSKSVSNEKRHRDALDIFLTIKQSRDINALVDSIKHLKQMDINTYNTLYGIREAYDSNLLLTNTYRFIEVDPDDFRKTIEKFFDEIGLTKQATN